MPMQIPVIIRKINWRLIVIHLVATIFIMQAFQTLVYLYDTNLYDNLHKLAIGGNEYLDKNLQDKSFRFDTLMVYFIYCSWGWLLGLVVAVGISLAIVKKRKWGLINSLLIFFLLPPIMGRIWYLPRKLDLLTANWFSSTFFYLLSNGLLWLGLGIFVFLYNRLNNFIKPEKNAISEFKESGSDKSVLQHV